MRIELETITTVINAPGLVKPTAPIYQFVNDGMYDVYLNNNFLLRPQQTFGISAEKLSAAFLKRSVQVQHNTQYLITFGRNPSSFILEKLTLIQTYIKLVH